MRDVESALEELAHVRGQLAASTRFHGLPPLILMATGVSAVLLAAYQQHTSADEMTAVSQWIVLALACAGLIGAEAIIRARRIHRSMADAMVATTLRHFTPACAAGVIVATVVLLRAPEATWLLPGIWQIAIAMSVAAALSNLPRSILLVSAWYFLSGFLSLLWASGPKVFLPWTMGVSFGGGQLLIGVLLHFSSGEDSHG